jgi:hypothetical protein
VGFIVSQYAGQSIFLQIVTYRRSTRNSSQALLPEQEQSGHGENCLEI